MKHAILTFLVIGLSLYGQDIKKDACYTCHTDIDEDLDVQVMTHIDEDVHIKLGLSCADCHGGDPTAFDDADAAMWDNDTFVGAPERTDQPDFCGKCHNDPNYMRKYSATVRTDEIQQYWTSKHGLLLKKGNQKVAVCTSCHGVHGILPKEDPRSPVYATHVPETCNHCHGDKDYMAEFGIPTDQFDKYKKSVHGKALLEGQDTGAPACNDCHGNHGAQPPNVVTIADICGTCHVNNRQLFIASHLNFNMVQNGDKQCVECHGNHDIEHFTDEALKSGTKTFVCKTCHDLHGNKAAALSNKMYTVIDSLKQETALANSLINQAEQKGMEVSDLYSFLDDSHRALIQTRTSIHSFNIKAVEKTAAPGYKAISAAIDGAQKSLKEYGNRRKSLVVFTIIVTFLVIMMIFKIKDMQKNV